MFGICFWHEQSERGDKNIKNKKKTRKDDESIVSFDMNLHAGNRHTHTRVTCFPFFFLFFFGVIDVYSTWKSHRRIVFLFFSFTYFLNVAHLEKTCC